ncbi:hypothetical protein LP420_22510 [Massilia sp. B-10]|nr:hypothetical protein LP420_22510 [Massilia sp. B-10]UUZ52276.1 hypothetical protein LP419_21975 [Massilia sp. H-1]
MTLTRCASLLAPELTRADFFGVAYGQEASRYKGFHFAENTSVIFDDSLLLIEPNAASEFAANLAAEAVERETAATVAAGGIMPRDVRQVPDSYGPMSVVEGSPSPAPLGSAPTTTMPAPAAAAKKRMFFGTVDLDPIKAKLQFSDVAEEVLMLFTQKPGVKVRISIEIEAESPTGFDDGVQRAVRENCNQLKFKNQAFEE